jgi:hypothetical protein
MVRKQMQLGTVLAAILLIVVVGLVVIWLVTGLI